MGHPCRIPCEKGESGRSPSIGHHSGLRGIIQNLEPFDKVGTEPKTTQAMPQVITFNRVECLGCVKGDNYSRSDMLVRCLDIHEETSGVKGRVFSWHEARLVWMNKGQDNLI